MHQFRVGTLVLALAVGCSPSSGTTPAGEEPSGGKGTSGGSGDDDGFDPSTGSGEDPGSTSGAAQPAPTCDDGLELAADAEAAARAIELCGDGSGDSGGVLKAAYVRADGSAYGSGDLQHGIVDAFGPNVKPQRGQRMLVLSSGYARLPGQPGACTSMSCYTNGVGTPPPGFPADVPGCAASTAVRDDVALEVQLRSPTGATGYSFSFKFYSFEFAEWVCTDYNDQFVTLVSPPPMGADKGNIAFDGNKNPVSVNIAFFDVCTPGNDDFAAMCPFSPSPSCPAKPSPYCPKGGAELAGTGFDDTFGSGMEDAGATSWLQTQAPVGGGEEITVRFAIWDTGDDNLDSTVVIDAFEWIGDPGVEVGTDPVRDPK